MINVVICDNDERFINTFSKVITWFLKSEELETNIIVVSDYNEKFNDTLSLNNQMYFLCLPNSYEIINKINNKNKDIPVILLNDKCKKSFFNFLSGNTSLKSNDKDNFSNNKTIVLKENKIQKQVFEYLGSHLNVSASLPSFPTCSTDLKSDSCYRTYKITLFIFISCCF